MIEQAVKSFKPGTAPGPSGLRAEHIKEATSPTVRGYGETLKALQSFVTKMSEGSLPASVAPFFCGANLFAAIKKDGGRRPIAVGEVLRRLVSKCVAYAATPLLSDYLQPLQMGVRVQGGCEAAIHAVRSAISDSDNWILQVDFVNAFNLVNREALFQEVRAHIPALAAWVETCYGGKSNLILALV